MRKSLILITIFLLLFMTLGFAQEKVQIGKDLEKIIIVPNPDTNLKIDLWLNKAQGSVYKIGESLVIYAKANDDVYLYIYDITPDGAVRVIFPNTYSKDNFIKKDRTYNFPDKSTYRFEVSPPFGKEYIVAVITKKPMDIFPGKRFESMAPGSLLDEMGEKALGNLQNNLKKEESKTWAQSVTYFYVQEVQQKSKININSKPSGAQVYVNDKYQGDTPLSLMLSAGNYRITLKKEGYEDYNTNIVVQEGRDRDYTFNLKAAYGNLRIEASPSGSSVYLDGVYKGTTPLTLYNLPAKTYLLRITHSGYQERVERVEVEPNKTNYVSYSLLPIYGSLNINSNPQGADVYLNGVYRGKTPAFISDLAPGRYQIQLRLNGYKDYVSFVDVSSGTTSYYNLTLVPLSATLNFFSNPQGAEVYLNGVYKGKTPISISDLSSGSYDVRMVLSGYEEYRARVDLSPGEVRQVSITLNPISSEVYIDSRPQGAKVIIDGKYQGVTPITLRLPEGKYNLTLTSSGYADLNNDIYVEKGKSSYFFVLSSLTIPTNVYYLNFSKGGYEGNLLVKRAENVFIGSDEDKTFNLSVRPSGVFEVRVPGPFRFKNIVLKLNVSFPNNNKREIEPRLIVYINGKNITLPISVDENGYVVLKWDVTSYFVVDGENSISLNIIPEAQDNVRIKEIIIEGK